MRTLRDHTPDPRQGGMIWSDLHGNMQSAAEMTAPPLLLAEATNVNGPKVAKFLVG